MFCTFLPVATAILGWLVANYSQNVRGRRDRRREFIKRIETWRSSVDRRSEVEQSAKEFLERIDAYNGEARSVQSDLPFWKRSQFSALWSDIQFTGTRIGLTENEDKDQTGRRKFTDALNAAATALERMWFWQ